jgi:hypothetical protein
MNKSGRRWIAVVIAVIMALAMMPLSAGAAGGTRADGRPPATPKAKSPSVRTHASSDSIRVTVASAAKTAKAFDFYRSTTAGERGVKVNDEAVAGRSFVDESAKPGVQYYYTAVVTDRAPAKKGYKDRVPDVTVFPQAKAEVIEVAKKAAPKARHAKRVHDRAAHDSKAVGREARHASAAVVAKVGTAASLVSARTVVASGTVLNVNTTWTKAASPYYLEGDVVVAAGKTLTIQPGAQIYFADFADAGTWGTDFGINSNPTNQCDLVVHGRLTAVGTATDAILFSSVRASLIATPADPAPTVGDWGSIFFDSMAASAMTYCDVQYGQGIWAKGTARPYLTNCDIVNVCSNDWGGAPLPWAAVWFEDPATDLTTPRARLVGNHVASPKEAVGIYWWAPTGSKTLDPYIVGNTFRGVKALDMGCETATDTGGNFTLKGTVANNTMSTGGGASSDEAVYLYVETTGTATARVQTAFTNNKIWSQDDEGVYAEAYNYQTGAADCVPTFSGGYIYAYSYGLDCEAYSDEGSSTTFNRAWASPVVSNCEITSNNEDAIYLYADTDGAGTAKADSSFTKVTFETASGNGIYDYAESEYGAASASPRFTDCTGYGHDSSEVVYCEAYSYGDSSRSGSANASPYWLRGRLYSGADDAIYNYAEADGGRATAQAQVIDCRDAYAQDSIIYSEAYGDDETDTVGGANASSTFKNSVGFSYGDDDLIYNYADASGPSVASPLVYSNSRLVARYSSAAGITNEAYSDKASATANARVYDSTIFVQEEGIDSYAECSDSDAQGNAVCSPTLLRSTVDSQYYTAALAEAHNYGFGNAVVSPAITSSTLMNEDDDPGLDIDVTHDGTGDSICEPKITDSTIASEDEALDVVMDGSSSTTHTTRVAGSTTGSKVRSEDENAVDIGDVTGGGTVSVKPTASNSTFRSGYDDTALYVDLSSDTSGTTEFAPVFDHVTLDGADYGIELYADGAGNMDSPVKANGTFTDTYIRGADSYGVYWDVTNGGGDCQASPVFTRCTIDAPDDYGVYFDVDGYGSATEGADITCAPKLDHCNARRTGDGLYFWVQGNSGATTDTVVCAPDIMYTPVYATWDYPLETYAYNSGHGPATNDTYVLRSDLYGYYGVYMYAYSNNDGDALTSSKFYGTPGVGNAIDSFWYYGIYSYTYSANADATERPVIKDYKIESYNSAVYSYADAGTGTGDRGTCSTWIERVKAIPEWDFDDDGFFIEVDDAWSGVLNPTVKSCTITGPSGDGISMDIVASNEGSGTPLIQGNNISYCGGDGIDLRANGAAEPATDSAFTIKGNTITRTYDDSIYVLHWANGLITQNKTAYAGYQNSTDYSDSAGVYWYDAEGGQVKGNLIRGNRYGVSLESCDPYPMVNYNSFADSRGRTNKWNVWTDCSTVASVNAENNWWKYTASADISRTINEFTTDGAVDYLPALGSLAPKLTQLTATKVGNQVRFTLKFDRLMDTSIRTLRFGRRSPYTTYRVTGNWQSDGKTWKGTFVPRSVLPTGMWMYFSGAKDLPGTAMNSTSKKFKL